MAPKKSKKPDDKAAADTTPKPKNPVPYWIGFDLGGTKMLASVFDENYQILGTARKATNGSDGQAKGRKRILAVLNEAIADANVEPSKLMGIGMACPGLVNTDKGILIHAPNLGWSRMALGDMLTKAFGKPSAILNDVDAGTFGEYKIGAAKGARSVLGVFPGTGLGAGFVYDGRLIMGLGVSCMELGNLVMPGTHIGSEQFGAVALEDLTSRLAFAAESGVACYRGQAPMMDKKTKGSIRDIRSKALAGSVKAPEEAILRIARNSIRYLGMGVASVVNLLAPDHITLGGGLVEELPDLYLSLLREEVNRYAMPPLSKGIKYSIAKLGGNAVTAGSVAWLRDNPPT